MSRIRVTNRSRMAVAVIATAGLLLAVPAFPATATAATAATSPSTSANVGAGPGGGRGTAVGSSPGVTTSPTGTGSAGTVISTGQTLTYNEGAEGYCTWWAIYLFHVYTGVYPDFFDPANDGNAGYWAIDAAYDGWTVTSTPQVNSIAVFPPGVDGAEYDGHVAWVTAVSGPQITISEMNGPAGWDEIDSRTLTPDPSVDYILAP